MQLLNQHGGLWAYFIEVIKYSHQVYGSLDRSHKPIGPLVASPATTLFPLTQMLIICGSLRVSSLCLLPPILVFTWVANHLVLLQMLCVRFLLCYYSYSACTFGETSGGSETNTIAAIFPESLAILHYIFLLNILKAGILWLILTCFHSYSTILHEEYKMFASQRECDGLILTHTHTQHMQEAFKSIPRFVFLFSYLLSWA